jgi:twitching motility protein PilT
MIATRMIQDLIRNQERTFEITEFVAKGKNYGMQTFDQSLYHHFKGGLITLDEALRRASNPDEFRLKVQGVQFTSDVAREEMESTLESPGAGQLEVERG